jgi:hypothetical protein
MIPGFHTKSYSSLLKGHVFISSFLAFCFLNIIENLIHYSIGRTSNRTTIDIKMPTKVDWIRIVLIMIVFAILQGVFTCVLSGCT